MKSRIHHSELHRTAKLFMDSGKAVSYEAAMATLAAFGLTILVGPEIGHSSAHQTALLTLVNVARRTLLAGVEVIGLPDVPSTSPIAGGQSLHKAVRRLHGRIVAEARPQMPTALIGSVDVVVSTPSCWRLTWEGWRGGATPARDRRRLAEDAVNPLAPVLAAAACASEVFSFLAQDHPMAGRRPMGMSLWAPGNDWLRADGSEPTIANLPSNLWIIGLGNLGQAFAWCLVCLPYPDPADLQLVLQDFDRVAKSNDSTSVLSFLRDNGRRKARVVGRWLDERGFDTFIEERRFGKATRRSEDEPGVALCGVDNALARSELGEAGFDLIVEAGLGAGPQAFRSIVMHTFPASRTPSEIWSRQVGETEPDNRHQPAYQSLAKEGLDDCGLALLASRTVGVPFVGLVAACLAISELLRRLNGGVGLEVASLSALTFDVDLAVARSYPYEFGHVPAHLPDGRPSLPEADGAQAA